MTRQPNRASLLVTLLLSISTIFAVAFASASFGSTAKTAMPLSVGPPQTIAAGVARGKVNATTADQVLDDEVATALVTVQYADTISTTSEETSTEGAIVKDSHVYAERKDAALGAAGSDARRVQDFDELPVMLVRITSQEALQQLVGSPGVVSIEPDRRNHLDLAQSLPLIRQPQVAAAGNKGAGTSVAILDTGVEFHNSAFGSCSHAGDAGCAVAYAQDFAPGDGSNDDNGHGTNVAGIALGVAPSTKILALDVFEDGSASDSDILDAVNWAIANQNVYDIRAMNLSLGTGDRHTSECSTSSYSAPFAVARSVGILPVVAAGNFAYVNGNYEDGVAYPACSSGAVRVGAVYDSDIGDGASWNNSPNTCTDSTTAADKITCFSQSGELLSLLAPGSEITAAGITESGTSQATPHVAGAAAVLAAAKPTASVSKIERSLEASGPAITDPRNGVTRHRLDLADAVENVEAPDAVVEDAGCAQNVFPANDDGSTATVALPFTLNFFGNLYAEAYVNNNGNITFEQPMSTYTPFSITSDVPPMIAPFFADVDTRGSGSQLVTYGATTYGGRPAFCVDWVDVGYFNSHSDKTNSFQLLLVDRSNLGVGDFDIVMNYDQVGWETGDASNGHNGFGGTPAAAGYSAGDGEAAHFFTFPGSITAGAFLDDNADGLIHRSRGSQQAGRYLFPIRNGLAPGNAALGGEVTGPGGAPLHLAPVQACLSGGQCVTTRTTADGEYLLSALAPGDYEVKAFPPAGSSLVPAAPVESHLADGLTTTVNFALDGPTGPPPGTTITDHGTTEDGVPVLNWNDPLTLTTTACPGGVASYEISIGQQVLRSGQMNESPAGSGHYSASIAALYPDHGNAVTTITSTCPDPGDDGQLRFDIYIDPSGMVVDRLGRPVVGATVTLLRSDTSNGPFEIVPAGGSEMSPANRVNPDTTDGDGSFGWDVIAGFYEVRASKPGCVSAADPNVAYAETSVLEIPPPATNLVLRLDCGGDGGGGGNPGPGGGPLPIPSAPLPPAVSSWPASKPLACRKGFKKKRSGGKIKCVKVKKHHKAHKK
jgi:Subtilase family/Nidogen-like